MAELQILISAYGADALQRLEPLEHAAMPGVEYLIGWQAYDKGRIPESISSRPDVKIFFEESRGLCNNRNALFRHADGDIAVIADDDLAYTPRHLENLMKGCRENSRYHLLTFRYESKDFPKTYPQREFDLSHPPKGYFVTSMELAFNLARIREDFGGIEKVRFNPNFGINGNVFGSGEEDILVNRLLKLGMKGRFIPEDICLNTNSTTSERIGSTQPFIETKGAVVSHIKPFSWPIRMLTHAFREKNVGVGSFCKWWIAGIRKAKKHKVFHEE